MNTIISINDVGRTSEQDTLALAIIHSNSKCVSLSIDWGMHPEEICQSVAKAADCLSSDGHCLTGFAGTGLGAVIALLMAKPSSQRWLALDMPVEPGEFFKKAAKSSRLKIKPALMKEALKWWKIAEENMLAKAFKFLRPGITRPGVVLGESFVGLTAPNDKFEKWLNENECVYTRIEGRDNLFAELISVLT